MTVLLVDGNNLLSRAIFGASGMTTSDEQWNTAPLVAFAGTISRLVRQARPAYMAVCWDAGPSAMRREIYPHYKAARQEHPSPDESLVKESHFALAKRLLLHCGVQQVACPGFEADDVVAAYWNRHRQGDTETIYIASGDKDFHQLLDPIDPEVIQIRPLGGGGYEEFGYQRVLDKYGCTPRQLPKLMALMGDQTDGVPGVRGLGPKKALKGLQEAEWELELVAALDTPEKLADARMSWTLVDLRNPVFHPHVPPLRAFRPVRPGDGSAFSDLMVFLGSLELESISNKIVSGAFWEDSPLA